MLLDRKKYTQDGGDLDENSRGIVGRVPLLFVTIFFTCLIVSSHTASAKGNTTCDVSKLVQVTGTEVYDSEAKYRKTRDLLLRSLLVEAAARVNGAEIMSRRSDRLEVKNDSISLQSLSYDAVKSRGLILSYSFPLDGESVSETALGPMLNLTVDVVVCDQSNIVAPMYIAIERINLRGYKGYIGTDLVEVAASAIPYDSNLVYVNDKKNSGYNDFVVSGQILSVSATIEENRMLKAIGRTVTANGQPIVDHLEHRLSAIIALKAYNVADESYTLVHETIEQKIPYMQHKGALARRIDEFIASSLSESTQKLYQKVINQEDFKKIRKP